MARIVKVEDSKQHRLRIKADHGFGEMVLVRGGRRLTYLWAGHTGTFCITLSGEKALRKLAESILAEIKPK